MNDTAHPTASPRFVALPMRSALRRLAAGIRDWFAAIDLTTTAPLHYLSIPAAVTRHPDPVEIRRFTP
jgi:hypothetical protein